uniref:Uncharacterized protein n=1 Tax=Physcomitrium patens TaxID=3218 RepID=A0A2K1I9W5_PHYPA|nr:hypothetical protein PHYPA_031160 [Physcomitrium patens]
MESFRRRRRSEGKGVSEIARVRLHEAFSQNVDAVITPPDCCCAFLYTLFPDSCYFWRLIEGAAGGEVDPDMNCHSCISEAF